MTNNLLVTGASTGLGVSIAVQAAQAGYKVYATMRNLEKRALLDEAASNAGVSLEVRQLDVQDISSINACVDAIIAEDGKLDVLVNNAGAGFVRTTEQASEEEVQWVMDVNFMGVMRCTKAVLPHMRKTRAGHVVAVTSVGGLVGQPFNEIYCAAKFAVEGYIEALASYVTPSFGIHFTAVEPGGIVSEFANSVMQQAASTGGILEDEYKPIIEKYIGGSAERQANQSDDAPSVYQTADEVAAVVMQCVSAESPPIRRRTSEWAEQLCELKTSADPDGKALQAKVIEMFL